MLVDNGLSGSLPKGHGHAGFSSMFVDRNLFATSSLFVCAGRNIVMLGVLVFVRDLGDKGVTGATLVRVNVYRSNGPLAVCE